jgi:aspartate aminotransferase
MDQGKTIDNLTVGDFSSAQFPIPKELEDGLIEALRAGETTYPPASGMESLRQAIREYYLHRWNLDFPIESILVTAGARPPIYGVYRALVDAGDKVVFGVPCWNNEYYGEMLGAEQVTLDCDASTGFLPTAEMLRPHLRGARLLALNSPLNPTGTAFTAEQLGAICDLVLEENARRGANERPLFVMYDQVYWMITVDGVKHVDPISVRPAMRQYTILVDAISKSFAATGLRVGWAVAPPDIMAAMSDVTVHTGAWAPKAEQIATAKFLVNHAAVDRYMHGLRTEIVNRLHAMYDGLIAMRDDGLPVDAVRPQGGIYVSGRFALHGLQTPEGRTLTTDEDVRWYLLHAAGLAIIPFNAFGSPGDRGWFRISIGIVTVEQINTMLPRVRAAVDALVGEPATR